MTDNKVQISYEDNHQHSNKFKIWNIDIVSGYRIRIRVCSIVTIKIESCNVLYEEILSMSYTLTGLPDIFIGPRCAGKGKASGFLWQLFSNFSKIY